MKKLLLLSVPLVLLAGCNLPIGPGAKTPPPEPPLVIITEAPIPPGFTQPAATEPPAEAPTPPPGTELNLGGVYMLIPPCLPVSASGLTVPAQLFDPEGGPQEVYPQHRRVSFSGYPLSGTFFEPFMRVFPVEGFTSAYAAAPENYAAPIIAQMQTLLATRPPDGDASLPFLVMAGAGQVFHAQAKYLDFANGSGVRYLTSYGQYYVPYNNHDLFYTFQGLTTDGKYWVSVIFPVNHPLLPPTYDSSLVPPGGIAIPSFTSPSYDEDMSAYYAAMKALMNSQPDNTFTPALDCLDAYITSLHVGD